MQKRNLSKFDSDRIKVLSLLMMIFIVFLHSYNLEVKVRGVEIHADELNFFIQNFISDGITRIAVPAFFLVSGFLFFLNYNGDTGNFFVSKFKSRLRSLVLPYLFWCIAGLLFFLSLKAIPAIGGAVNAEISFTDPVRLVRKVFLDPFFYQFWFIRDLIIYVLFSPLILFLILRLGFAYIGLLAFVWLVPLIGLPYPADGILFFSCGGFLALRMDVISVRLPLIGLLSLSAFWVISVFVKFYQGDLPFLLYNGITRTGIIVGIMVAWELTGKICDQQKILEKMIWLASFSFIIFALHEPLLTIIEKIYFLLLPLQSWSLLLLYLISPVAVISAIVFTAFWVRKTAPGIFAFITGGR